MKLRYKKWCKEYGIPEQKVNLKFWLSGQYQNTRKEAEALKEAREEPSLQRFGINRTAS